MKKITSLALVLFIATGLTAMLVSCEKDKDHEPKHIVVDTNTTDNGKDNHGTDDGKNDADTIAMSAQVAGTYHGTLAMHLQEMPDFSLPTMDDAEITLSAAGYNNVNIELPAVGYDLNGTTMGLPGAMIEGIRVEKNSNGNFTLQQTAINTVIDQKSYSGRIGGTVSDGQLTLNYSVKYGKMPMTLVFTFTSSR